MEAVQKGAKGYIVKPFTPDVLKNKVQDVLGIIRLPFPDVMGKNLT
jgi:DNA-binding response OmpR family regulator